MYTKIISGQAPVILSVPHDGEVMLEDTPKTKEWLRWMQQGYDGRDYGTTICAHACRAMMKEVERTPILICFQVSRSQIDVNRDLECEPYVTTGRYSEFCRAEYAGFHHALHTQVARSLDEYGCCLLVDMHSFEGFWMGEADVVFGTKESRLCPLDWSEVVFQGLSRQYHPTLGRTYRVTYSPDRAGGVGGGLSGGYVTRQTIETFHSSREEWGLGAIQIEVRRQPFFLEHPEIVGVHLARALLGWLDKVS